jgi:hypothetical protein
MVNTHGLATSIRSAQESETFDLGGQSASTITATMEAAFEEPFDHANNFADEPGGMIRLTFVTGAGKQARAKYDDGAVKVLTAALVKFGYVEDRGASCVVECAGTYKQQHDTGKNLKTVVVFPKIKASSKNNNNGGASDTEFEPLIPTNSPGFKIASAPITVFQNMIRSKCPSWSDKKGALSSLEGLQNILQDLEEKLMHGTPFDESEQHYYDSMALLSDKEAFVKQEMHSQVEEAGDVTAFEKEFLLQQVEERISQLKKDGNNGSNKSLLDKVKQRQTMLKNIVPEDPHPLRHESQIAALRKELVPLLKMEAAARGRLLSVKETQTMSRKDEIEEEIEYLEQTSQGWFEEEDSFQSRVEASRLKCNGGGGGNNKNRKNNKSSRGGGGGGSSGAGAGGGGSSNRAINWLSYSTATQQGGWKEKEQKDARKMRKRMAGHNGKGGAGNVFSAMMNADDDDSSSDSEDESDNEGEKEEENVSPSQSRLTNTSSQGQAGAVESDAPAKKKKKNKKKKKKKKSSQQTSPDDGEEEDEDDEADTAVGSPAGSKPRAGTSSEEEEASPPSLAMTAAHVGKVVAVAIFEILRDYAYPMLLALLGWFISKLTGKKSSSSNNAKKSNKSANKASTATAKKQAKQQHQSVSEKKGQ